MASDRERYPEVVEPDTLADPEFDPDLQRFEGDGGTVLVECY